MTITQTEKILIDSKTEIIEMISELFSKVTHDKFDYKSGWLIFESAAQNELAIFLSKKFPKAIIQKAKDKNQYPDVCLETEDGKFAIDIKASASEKDPEFDIARLDTIIKKRLEIFKEEWEIIIKYEKKTGKFVNVFFILLREVVGENRASRGIKFRLYDGKVRPKSWKDFDCEQIYWTSKVDFIIGVKKSMIFRYATLISNFLVPEINEEEKKHFISLFDKPIPLFEELKDDNDSSDFLEE